MSVESIDKSVDYDMTSVMIISGIEFTTSDLILLGIGGAIALVLIIHRLIAGRNNGDS